MTFREMKRRARLDLHAHMSEPALYLSGPTAAPVACTVRLHLNFNALGELSPGFAERQELTPRIVFLAGEVGLVRNGFVITRDMGAWRIENDLPPDDVTVTAEVGRLTRGQILQAGWNPDAEWLGFPPPV